MQSNDYRDFNAVAAKWDEEPRRVLLAQEITAAIVQEVPLFSRMTVLDYGCGTGLVTLGIQPHVGQITGADSSQGMLNVLLQKVMEQGIHNISTRLIDVTAQDHLEGDFDLIVSSMTMHHVKDISTLISSLMTVMKPGGWLALADLEAEDGSFHGDLTGVFHHGFTRSWFQELLRGKGFSDVRVITAATIIKNSPDGGERLYPVFLAVGRKCAKTVMI